MNDYLMLSTVLFASGCISASSIDGKGALGDICERPTPEDIMEAAGNSTEDSDDTHSSDDDVYEPSWEDSGWNDTGWNDTGWNDPGWSGGDLTASCVFDGDTCAEFVNFADTSEGAIRKY